MLKTSWRLVRKKNRKQIDRQAYKLNENLFNAMFKMSFFLAKMYATDLKQMHLFKSDTFAYIK